MWKNRDSMVGRRERSSRQPFCHAGGSLWRWPLGDLARVAERTVRYPHALNPELTTLSSEPGTVSPEPSPRNPLKNTLNHNKTHCTAIFTGGGQLPAIPPRFRLVRDRYHLELARAFLNPCQVAQGCCRCQRPGGCPHGPAQCPRRGKPRAARYAVGAGRASRVEKKRRTKMASRKSKPAGIVAAKCDPVLPPASPRRRGLRR